jgi:hypothetical protein
MRQSVAVIRGKIVEKQTLKKGGLSLTLRSESGTFAVRLDEKLAQDTGLGIGQAVTVSGQLRSFIFKGCRSRHVYLEAQAIELGRDSPDLEQELVRRYEKLVGSEDQGEIIVSPKSGR